MQIVELHTQRLACHTVDSGMILYAGRTHDATFLVENRQISAVMASAGATEPPRVMLNPFGGIGVTMPRQCVVTRGVAAIATTQGCHINCTSLFEAV